jgi:uncharacterized protein (DUF1697 family)
MPRSIALLRAVNLGAKRKVKMADVREALTDAGYSEVETYIQSGNVVVSHPRRSVESVRADLEARISAVAGFDVPTTVRTAKQWSAVIEANPFPTDDYKQLHVTFLFESPAAGAFDGFDAAPFAPDTFAIGAQEVYFHLPDGLGRAKLPDALERAGPRIPGTSRNWRTVEKLAEMVGA